MLNAEYINYQSSYLNSLGIENAKNEIIWYLEHLNIISKEHLLLSRSEEISLKRLKYRVTFIKNQLKIIHNSTSKST